MKIRLRRERWTSVPEAILEDLKLSERARLILAWCLGKSDDFDLHVWHIQKTFKLSKKQWVNARRELEEKGYYRARRLRQADGMMVWELDVYYPAINPWVQKPPHGEPPHGEPPHGEPSHGGGGDIPMGVRPMGVRGVNTHPAPCAGTPMAHAPWGGCLAFLKASGLSSGRANLAHKLLSEMSLQGGGKLEECDWEDILQNLASGGVDDSIAWLKSISRNGWRRGKLKDIARPGETVQQVKTRVSAQSGKLNEEGRLNEAVNEDKAIEFACLRPGGFKSFVSSSLVLKSMINGWEGERDKFPHGLKKEAMEFYMLNAKQAIA